MTLPHWSRRPAPNNHAATTRLPKLHPLWARLACLLLIAAATWLPRGLALDLFVTIDESLWLTRSASFYYALAHGDLAGTYQQVHPGVTATWAGTAAFLWRYPEYVRQAPEQIIWWKEDVGQWLWAHGRQPMELLAAARVFMLLGVTLALTAAAWFATRLIGVPAALLGFLLIASDPFHIALTRLLHLDGLVSSLMLLSLLAFLSYLHRGRRRLDLVVSAIAAGAACLTKSPAIFLAPFAALLVLLELWSKSRAAGRLDRAVLVWGVQSLLLWTLLSLAVFVLLWPAMWVAPLHAVTQIVSDAARYSTEGHDSPLFFDGAVVDGDPGLHFYPITYLWRTTPPVLLGLLLAAALGPGAGRWLLPAERGIAGRLALFVVLFTLFLSLPAKKFDRYLLPVYPPADLVAALGWLAAGRWLQARIPARARSAVPAMACLAVAGQAACAVPAYPYYLSYYNPFVGGTPRAPAVMMVGWGEGLDQVARTLDALPNAEQLRVVSEYERGPLSYLFRGKALSPRLGDNANPDYRVVYINEIQRLEDPRELAYLAGRTPVQVVRIQGLEYALLYRLRE